MEIFLGLEEGDISRCLSCGVAGGSKALNEPLKYMSVRQREFDPIDSGAASDSIPSQIIASASRSLSSYTHAMNGVTVRFLLSAM